MIGWYNGLIGNCIVDNGNELQGWMFNVKKRGWMGSRGTRSWMNLIYVKQKGKWFKNIDKETSVYV